MQLLNGHSYQTLFTNFCQQKISFSLVKRLKLSLIILIFSLKIKIIFLCYVATCTVKLLSLLTCSLCVHWYCTDAKLWDLFPGKQYNVLLIFKFLINYSPLANIRLSFFVYLSSDVSGLRSPGVHATVTEACGYCWRGESCHLARL